MTELVAVDTEVIAALLPKLNHFIVDQQQCWLHQYATTKYGYVNLRFYKDGKVYNYHAHRVSYMLYKGPIPDGMDVCHTCDIRNCINPDHLFLGTRSDNNQDMIKKYRGNGRHGPQVDEETEMCIVSLKEEGHSVVDISKWTGFDKTTVYKVLKRVNKND